MGIKSRGNFNIQFCIRSEKCKTLEETTIRDKETNIPICCEQCFKFSLFKEKT